MATADHRPSRCWIVEGLPRDCHCRICEWTGRAGRSKDKEARAGWLRQEMTMKLKLACQTIQHGCGGFLANLLREARSKRKYVVMRD